MDNTLQEILGTWRKESSVNDDETETEPFPMIGTKDLSAMVTLPMLEPWLYKWKQFKSFVIWLEALESMIQDFETKI